MDIRELSRNDENRHPRDEAFCVRYLVTVNRENAPTLLHQVLRIGYRKSMLFSRQSFVAANSSVPWTNNIITREIVREYRDKE